MRKVISALAVTLLAAGTAFAADTATPGTVHGEFGNQCAYGLTMGKQVMTDCKINWQDPTTHKTYCFSSEEAKTNWAKDVKSNIAKADTTFGKVAGGTTHTHTGHSMN